MNTLTTTDSVNSMYERALKRARSYIIDKEKFTEDEISLLGEISMALSEGKKLKENGGSYHYGR